MPLHETADRPLQSRPDPALRGRSTDLVDRGPTVGRELLPDLGALLERDGFAGVPSAVGT